MKTSPRILSVLFAAAAIGWCLRAQAPDPKASVVFDVAAIKPTADRTVPGMVVHLPGEQGYRGKNMPLLNYLNVAYQVRVDQITGPDWLATENFDMEGKAGHASTGDELHLMLQHLLEERFHIQMHREIKQVSGYSLVVDKGGPKMTEHDPEDKEILPIQPGRPPKNVSMQYLAFYLSQMVNGTVVDKTGLTGHYDIKMQWEQMMPMQMPMPMQASPDAPGAPGGPASLPMAQTPGAGIPELLCKQAGLRLDKAKVPSTQIVIDHIERLADN